MKNLVQICLVGFSLVMAGKSFGQNATSTPPMPPPSPVEQFRHWLTLPENEVNEALLEYPEDKRNVLLGKIKEYSVLPEQERERRLMMVELRHYLYPLMQLPPENYGEKLKQVPPSIKPLVLERLKQWETLEPNMQKAVLESEWASRYFIRLEHTRHPEPEKLLVSMTAGEKAEVENKLIQWKLLPQEERLRRYKQFNAFFELPPQKKEKTLGMLGDKDRAEMEKTLRLFSRLSPEQRSVCINSFRKFASMSPAERALFLANAERWKNMSPEDRDAWSMLVRSIPPLPAEMPPLPMDGGDGPPMP